MRRILTIGVYGWTADGWLASLRLARCDLVVDVRARRGVRGRDYAFANRTRLAAMLEAAGIRYVHMPELAPSRTIRAAQATADVESHTRKRDRAALGPAFVTGYEREVVDRVDWPGLASRIDAVAPAFLCVERLPAACHRSLITRRLSEVTGVPAVDLLP